MEISQLILAQLWLYAFFLGTGLGAVYDVLSITRVFLGVPFTPWVEQYASATSFPLLKNHHKHQTSYFLSLFSFIGDFLFSMTAFVSLVLLFYQMNNGKIRIPAMLAVALGFHIYRKSIGYFLRPALELSVLFIENSFRYVIYFLIFPLRFAVNAIRTLFSRLYRKHLRKKERKQRIRFTHLEMQRLSKNACGML